MCPSCLAIDAGTSFDVHELDAASNNGVDAIRDLIAKASLGTPGRTKVYILDEVHMLSTPASNALLKTLEEPPEHVVFVLATTDPQKVLPTIRSRTQHFDLHLLPATDLEALVDFVVADAGLDVDALARAYVLRAGAGSARDTLSALDRVVAAGGVPDDLDSLDELVEALCDRDTGRALIAVEASTARGRSPRVLGEALIARLRDVFLAAVHADLSRLSEADRERADDQARRLTAAGATRALELLGDAFVGIQDALDPRIPLEVALVRLTRADTDPAPAALAERVSRLEQALADGGGAAPAAARPAPPARPTPSTAGPAPTAPDRAPEISPDGPDGSDGRPAPEEADPLTGGDTPADPSRPARPADGARSQLSRTRAASPGPPRPTTAAAPAPASGTRQPPAPRRAAGAPPPAGEAPATAPRSAPRDDVTGTTEGPPAESPATIEASAPPAPTRDAAALDLTTLTSAWSDTVMAGLAQRPRVRFAGGRWLSVSDGAAVFGLPNPVHVQRCEECRAEVETALSSHFGQPVSVRIVVDDVAEAPQDHGAPRADTAEPDDEVDLAGLTDADDVAETGVDRVTAIFPGAQRVDPPPDRLL